MEKLLIIDNDPELCDLLSRYLKTERFNTTCTSNAIDGLKIALTQDFKAIILDLLLPDMSGLDIVKKIREHSQVPILMLTAKVSDIDKIIGLELGADDYLIKPCNPRELLARLKAIIRRYTYPESIEKNVQIGSLLIDPTKHSVFVNSKPLDLTNAEYNIIHILISAPEKAFSKEALTEHALNRKYTAFDRSIDVHISNLRNKLINHNYNESTIKTVRGYGYMFSLK